MTDYDYFSGDPKRLWQDQITGKINFDHSDFLGALSDLQTDPEWRQAFAAIENATGMPQFLDRLQKHFDLCQSPQNPDGSVNAFQHPSRTNQAGSEKDKDTVLKLMRRHLDAAADAVYKVFKEDDDVTLIKSLKILWTDDYASISTDVLEFDKLKIDTLIYDGMSEIEDYAENEGIPSITSCLREASYGLASSYDLQRYLMQDMYTHSVDVDALYELEWVNGCNHRFHGDTCVVFDAAAFRDYRLKDE